MASECEVEHETQATATRLGIVAVSETPGVVDAKHLEHIVKTYACFHIGSGAHQLSVGIGRKFKQRGIFPRTVAVAQVAI